jgi:hypothetical protein
MDVEDESNRRLNVGLIWIKSTMKLNRLISCVAERRIFDDDIKQWARNGIYDGRRCVRGE